MVYHDTDFFAGNKRLQFFHQTSGKGCVIVYGNIRNYVHGNPMLFLKVVEAMNL